MSSYVAVTGVIRNLFAACRPARTTPHARRRHLVASATCHDPRTTVTGMRTHREETSPHRGDAGPREALETVLSATARMDAIIQDVLFMTRLQDGSATVREPVDLGALVAEEVAGRAGGVPVKVDAAPGVQVLAAPAELARLLTNLLDNAQRHAASAVTVQVSRAGGLAVMTVTDDGPGVPHADRERVFQRFTRLRDARDLDPAGSGLGLPASREIAQAHGGTLGIEDSRRGARLVLRLPAWGAARNTPRRLISSFK
ncbi:HAMP domain-containing sensor histidine kinase [Sphaerisporangium sp. B11E5]|uniref:sensor histidine kinase n=1 Tax=Sphaerisporangium sp. B11E5 TaxID=3153563 RepID=UPI00325D34CF